MPSGFRRDGKTLSFASKDSGDVHNRSPGQSLKRIGSTSMAGTRRSVFNSQLLISCGITEFDEIIGGGLPLGAMCALQEDEHTRYFRVFAKYFAVEGIESGQRLVLVSGDEDGNKFVSNLPLNSENSEERHVYVPIKPDEMTSREKKAQEKEKNKELKIAWRYGRYSTVSDGHGRGGKQWGNVGTVPCHSYLLNKRIKQETLNNASISILNPFDEDPSSDLDFWDSLLLKLKHAILEGEKNSVTRVLILSYANPLWPVHSDQGKASAVRFIARLRGVLCNFPSVVVYYTIPGLWGKSSFLRHLLHTSDLVASVESFEGMGLTEESHGLGDFTGLCRIHRLPRLNTLARYFPDTALYAFKLRRQSLRLEKLHPLPEGESGGAASQRGERVLPPSAPHQSTHASLAADGLNSKSPQDSRVSDARVGEGQKPNTGMGDTARGVPTQGSKPAVHGVNLKDLEF